ncbi:MAG: NADP-dependent isocitrate dehydrogenase [Pseudohongiellaceae bacterium]
MKEHVTVAQGDGIGPEIMDVVLEILAEAGAAIEPQFIEVGEKAYRDGHSSGIRPQDWKTIGANRAFLKAPITTPQGGGYKSLNVTIRKTLGLFANVRPVRSLHPYVATRHPDMDLVIVRENEEDLYAGIEHRQTHEVYQCLKLMSRPGCERIVRYAFEYARHSGRNKVTCMTKDNIMKLTDGLFHKVFDEIRAEYKDIQSDHMIIDIGAARLADTPEQFDVVVVPNLYGDIVSDVVAQISGSVGLAGSANIGPKHAMFEAIHGSAPDIAGKNIANPGGLLMGALQMLDYIGQSRVGMLIENAWLTCIEDGVATADIHSAASTLKVGTREFVQEVIQRLGDKPKQLKAVAGSKAHMHFDFRQRPRKVEAKTLDGIDIFLHEDDRNPEKLGQRLQQITDDSGISLQMITNRGVKVYPDGNPETFCTDHWRARFTRTAGSGVSSEQLFGVVSRLAGARLDVIKTELLYSFDGTPGYSLGQGQ